MVDLLYELKSLRKRANELRLHVSNYTDILKMYHDYSMWFSNFARSLESVIMILDAYIDVAYIDLIDGDFGTLFEFISQYNEMYEEYEEYTRSGMLKPWDFREIEILDGTYEIQSYIEYKNSVKSLYDLNNLDEFPKKFVYLED